MFCLNLLLFEKKKKITPILLDWTPPEFSLELLEPCFRKSSQAIPIIEFRGYIFMELGLVFQLHNLPVWMTKSEL